MSTSSNSLNPFAFPSESHIPSHSQPPSAASSSATHTNPTTHHASHHQPTLSSSNPSSIPTTSTMSTTAAQRRQAPSSSPLDPFATPNVPLTHTSAIHLMDLSSSTSDPIAVPTSIIIEGTARLSYFSTTSPPQLSTPILAVYRVARSVSPTHPSNGLIKLEVMESIAGPNGTLLWSSLLQSLHAAKISPNCLFLTSSRYVSSRDVTDAKPAMPATPQSPSDAESSKRQPIPIVLAFSTAGELDRIQRCLVTFSPTVFCPSIQNISGESQTNSKATNNWCHLDSSDVTTVQTYFQYYGKMTNQMNMLQDSVRTELYRQSIFSNPSDFRGKRVMDVGAGSGILSFFSAQAGANAVYAVEASSMASTIATLAEANIEYGCRLRVVNRTVEALDLNRDLDGFKVDVLVSEPIGTFLFNERMIESYLFARDAFLKPGGRMYPNRCRLYLAPFSDPVLFSDISSRCTFWTNQDFYGLNLSAVVDRAIEEQLRQPVVDYIDPNAIVCNVWHQEEFDLETIDRASLANMEFNFCFPITTACLVHGIAGWFDVLFEGTERHVGFSTAPWCSPTHWYQIRFLLKHPIAANPGQTISGTLRMSGNSQQSYFITVKAHLDGTNVSSESTIIDLKDPDYRYYSNPSSSYVPPQNQTPNNMNSRLPTTSIRSSSTIQTPTSSSSMPPTS